MHAPKTGTSQTSVGVRRLWRARTNPYSAPKLARARQAAALISAPMDAAVDVGGFQGHFWGISRLRWNGMFVQVPVVAMISWRPCSAIAAGP